MWADGRVRVNATYYQSDFKNLQEASLRGGVFDTDTADADISGIEIEANAILFDDFTLGLQAGTIDSEVKSTGNRVKNTPEFSYTLMADYNRQLSNGGTFFASGSLAFEDTYFTNADNQREVEIPDHSILDLRIGYRFPNDRWEIELSGKNVLDEVYPTHGFFINPPAPPAGPGPLSTVQFPNRPRMIMARIKLNM